MDVRPTPGHNPPIAAPNPPASPPPSYFRAGPSRGRGRLPQKEGLGVPGRHVELLAAPDEIPDVDLVVVALRKARDVVVLRCERSVSQSGCLERLRTHRDGDMLVVTHEVHVSLAHEHVGKTGLSALLVCVEISRLHHPALASCVPFPSDFPRGSINEEGVQWYKTGCPLTRCCAPSSGTRRCSCRRSRPCWPAARSS